MFKLGFEFVDFKSATNYKIWPAAIWGMPQTGPRLAESDPNVRGSIEFFYQVPRLSRRVGELPDAGTKKRQHGLCDKGA